MMKLDDSMFVGSSRLRLLCKKKSHTLLTVRMSASFWETATYNEKREDRWECYSDILIISKSVWGRREVRNETQTLNIKCLEAPLLGERRPDLKLQQ